MVPPTESSNTTPDINVQVLLSRPWYRVGGTVVGTIIVSIPRARDSTSQLSVQPILRDRIGSLQLSMVGLCRYDPRWYNPSKKNTVATPRDQSSLFTVSLPNDYILQHRKS
jgi:hypothetical protein